MTGNIPGFVHGGGRGVGGGGRWEGRGVGGAEVGERDEERVGGEKCGERGQR